jgi:hypothetical protein
MDLVTKRLINKLLYGAERKKLPHGVPIPIFKDVRDKEISAYNKMLKERKKAAEAIQNGDLLTEDDSRFRESIANDTPYLSDFMKKSGLIKK